MLWYSNLLNKLHEEKQQFCGQTNKYLHTWYNQECPKHAHMLTRVLKNTHPVRTKHALQSTAYTCSNTVLRVPRLVAVCTPRASLSWAVSQRLQWIWNFAAYIHNSVAQELKTLAEAHSIGWPLQLARTRGCGVPLILIWNASGPGSLRVLFGKTWIACLYSSLDVANHTRGV